MTYLEFPKEEYLSRYRRLIKAGRGHGIDAFLFTDEQNLRYFAGGPLTDAFIFRPDYMAAVIPTDEAMPPAFVISQGRTAALRGSWITDTYTWGEKLESAGDATVTTMLKALKKLGVDKKRAALEVGENQKLFMPISVYEGIRKELPDMEVVPSHTVVSKIRGIKSPLEIEYIRKACTITAQAIEHGLSTITEGATEQDIYREVKKKMYELGAETVPFLTVIAGWEGRSICWDTLPTDYAVKEGDAVQIDGGCSVKGYMADMVRTGSLGELKDPRYRELYQVAREAHYAVRDKLRPGTAIKDLCEAGRDVIVHAGYKDHLVFGVGQTGHGFGLGMHEPPFLLPESEEQLRPGMVLAIEPVILEKPDMHQSRYFTILENDYLITEGGYEQLTTTPEEIRVIE